MKALVGSAPLTVLVSRLVRPGHEAEFERLMAEMIAAAERFAGHVGGFVIPPEDTGTGRYQTIFSFDNEEHLRAWNQSPQRQALLDQIAKVTYGDTAMRVLTGTEGWFILPVSDTSLPPPRHKMAFVAWLGIFPLGLIFSVLLGPVLSPIHPILTMMVVSALVTMSMTWLVMPRFVQLFAGWLYPKSSRISPPARGPAPYTQQKPTSTRHE